MNRCKWDRDQETYLRDGEPCRTDDYGDPTHHCTARRSCGNHIGRGEQTCAQCVGRTRMDLRKIRDHSPLMLSVALGAGVNSEAANLAGPAADYRVFSARRLLDKHWIHANIPLHSQERAMRNLLPDDDELHPYSVTTRWHLMLAEDYGHPLPETLTITDSTAYLERILPRMAQDPEQDFPLFRNEISKVWTHLEDVMANSRKPERGAPCPDCKAEGRVLRMSREYPHWCEDADCERMHYADDSEDRWVCPRGHSRTHEDYERWVEERNEVGA